MEVFISWSGERSEVIAKALRDWIPNVIQSVRPWMSAADIEKGARWHSEIAVHLNDSRVGISCLTPENLESPWLLFEAGAMSKQLQKPFVCTFLFDLKPTQVTDPLAQFQATRAEKADTLKLMQTIHRALGETALSDAKLITAFEKWWPELETALKEIPAAREKPAAPRPAVEMLEELLALVREQTRSIAGLSSAVTLPRSGLGSLFGSPPSDVGGGTAGTRFQDIVRTLVNQPTPEGNLARALDEHVNKAAVIARAIELELKERRKKLESQEARAVTEKTKPGQRDEAAT